MMAVDLFCGAGGLTRGLLNAGIDVALGVDINEDYSRTYETNNRPSRFLACDIQQLTAKEVREIVGNQRKCLPRGGNDGRRKVDQIERGVGQ